MPRVFSKQTHRRPHELPPNPAKTPVAGSMFRAFDEDITPRGEVNPVITRKCRDTKAKEGVIVRDDDGTICKPRGANQGEREDRHRVAVAGAAVEGIGRHPNLKTTPSI